MHLFDIDVPGRIRFMESETLSAGDNLCIVNLGQKNVLCVCEKGFMYELSMNCFVAPLSLSNYLSLCGERAYVLPKRGSFLRDSYDVVDGNDDGNDDSHSLSLRTHLTGFVKIGVAICYDIRFQEMMRLYALRVRPWFI